VQQLKMVTNAHLFQKLPNYVLLTFLFMSLSIFGFYVFTFYTAFMCMPFVILYHSTAPG